MKNKVVNAVDIARIETMVTNAFMENVNRSDFEIDMRELYGIGSINYCYAMHRYDSTTRFFDDIYRG